MRDGHAPSWGVETPTVQRRVFALRYPYDFCVGEPWTYVQAPKAKGPRSRVLSAFQLPDLGL